MNITTEGVLGHEIAYLTSALLTLGNIFKMACLYEALVRKIKLNLLFQSKIKGSFNLPCVSRHSHLIFLIVCSPKPKERIENDIMMSLSIWVPCQEIEAA